MTYAYGWANTVRALTRSFGANLDTSVIRISQDDEGVVQRVDCYNLGLSPAPFDLSCSETPSRSRLKVNGLFKHP